MYRVLSVVTVVLLKAATYNVRELSGVLFVQMVYYLEFSRKEGGTGAYFSPGQPHRHGRKRIAD
jgi:hypothetical protein